jgi:hypothetical protein
LTEAATISRAPALTVALSEAFSFAPAKSDEVAAIERREAARILEWVFMFFLRLGFYAMMMFF